MNTNIDQCLATYGSLAPGRPNHHLLSGLTGEWLPGTVRGDLVARGWGAALGYPALVPSPAGPLVGVFLLISPDLPDYWSVLDAFEGEQYRRSRIWVTVENHQIEAWIYLDGAA